MTTPDTPTTAAPADNVIDIHADCVCGLPSLSVIRVSGEDRLDFLHGQLTRDLQKLEPGQAGMSAWCNPKGRVIATLLLCFYKSHIDLVVASDLKEAVLKRLKMFVLRSRVVIEDCNSLSCIGLSGEAAEALLSKRMEAVPKAEWAIGELDDLAVVTIPGPASRYLLYGEHDAIEAMRQAVESSCQPAGENQWTLLNIETGLPWIDEAVSEQFLPQMLNMDQTGGLDFNKGCYPGQEVIARLHYRGEVKQRLRYGTSTATELAPGATLYNNSGERAGNVVNSVVDSDQQSRCLAVISTAAGSLYLGSAEGPAVEFST